MAYQQAQAVLIALDLLDSAKHGSLRVEGVHDIIDVEVFWISGDLAYAKQIKIRDDAYTWGKAELVGLLRRWASVPGSLDCDFEFLTDGRLGPTGDEVAEALDRLREGRRRPLAQVLGVEIDDSLIDRLRGARVRLDPSGPGILFSRAVRQIASILPDVTNVGDALVEAELKADRLFHLLMDRAGLPNSDDRFVTRAEVAELVGVEPEWSSTLKWHGGVRDACLTAAADLDDGPRIVPTLLSNDLEGQDGAIDLVELTRVAPALLSGRTGEGKSTALDLARRRAAAQQRIAIVTHAEAYIPGRLAALVAEGIAGIVDAAVPVTTGRAALLDPETFVMIDGVSEVPADIRSGLADDLRRHVASGSGAGIILAGRDLAALRSTLPVSTKPREFRVAPFDSARRRELIGFRLAQLGDERATNEAFLTGFSARLDAVLGSASGNPLLLKMATDVLSSGHEFTSRPVLYEQFLELLSNRSGASGLSTLKRVLGAVYVELLNSGRRYSDRYEWHQLVAKTATAQSVAGLVIDPAIVAGDALALGLVSPIGYTDVLAPIHDSFADYFAGAQHCFGAPWPTELTDDDEQRAAFAAEIGGINGELADLLAHFLPFASGRLSAHDERSFEVESPDEVLSLLNCLRPSHQRSGVLLWDDSSRGRVAAAEIADGTTSGWVDDLELLGDDFVVAGGGPLAIAVALWRRALRSLLVATGISSTVIRDQTHACEVLADHQTRVGAVVEELTARVEPSSGGSRLRATIGPVGITALVGPETDGPFGITYPLRYARLSDDVAVLPVTAELLDPEAESRGLGGSSSVESLIRSSVQKDACDQVRSAFESLCRFKLFG